MGRQYNRDSRWAWEGSRDSRWPWEGNRGQLEQFFIGDILSVPVQ